MQPVIDILDSRVAAAMKAVTDQADCAALVKPSANPKFGDYQANGIMALAKKLKAKPRELAEKVVKKLDIDSVRNELGFFGVGRHNADVDYLSSVSRFD